MIETVAHQEHIEWLKERKAQCEQELCEAETKLAEIKKLLEEKQANLAYFLNELERLSVNGSGVSSSPDRNGGEVSSGKTNNQEQNRTTSILGNEHKNQEPESAEQEEPEIKTHHTSEQMSQRKPKQMLKPEYQNMTLGDIAEKLLNSWDKEVTSDMIAEKIFDAQSDEEWKRAKNSLSTELRRGAGDERWKKTNRGLFCSNKKSRSII